MDVSQYLDVFIDETSEHMQNLSDCIMALENDPDDKDTINEIFRAAHSLKGMAGTMGFKRMQHLTHDMEDMFQEVRNDNIKVTSEMIDILFECLDAIEGYADNIKASSDEGTEDNQVLIDKLNAFLNGEAGASSDAPAEAPAEEAPAEAEADSSESDDMKFKKIELGDAERDAIKAAEDAGKSIYGNAEFISRCETGKHDPLVADSGAFRNSPPAIAIRHFNLKVLHPLAERDVFLQHHPVECSLFRKTDFDSSILHIVRSGPICVIIAIEKVRSTELSAPHIAC